jgi:hypothetical protein
MTTARDAYLKLYCAALSTGHGGSYAADLDARAQKAATRGLEVLEERFGRFAVEADLREQLDAQAKRIAELEGVQAQLLEAEGMVKEWEGQLQAYEKGHEDTMAGLVALLWDGEPPEELDESSELLVHEQWPVVVARVRELTADLTRARGLLDVANGVANQRAELILAYEKDALATLRAQHAARACSGPSINAAELTDQEAASYLSAVCGDEPTPQLACSIVHSLGGRFAALENALTTARNIIGLGVPRAPLEALVAEWKANGRHTWIELAEALKRADDARAPLLVGSAAS